MTKKSIQLKTTSWIHQTANVSEVVLFRGFEQNIHLISGAVVGQLVIRTSVVGQQRSSYVVHRKLSCHHDTGDWRWQIYKNTTCIYMTSGISKDSKRLFIFDRLLIFTSVQRFLSIKCVRCSIITCMYTLWNSRMRMFCVKNMLLACRYMYLLLCWIDATYRRLASDHQTRPPSTPASPWIRSRIMHLNTTILNTYFLQN